MRDVTVCEKCEMYQCRYTGVKGRVRKRGFCTLSDPIATLCEREASTPYAECHIPHSCPWYPAHFLYESEIERSAWKRLVHRVRTGLRAAREFFVG